jgi:pyruvate/2-oxoglutarate dehydrogenase complex dihydrolipoamide dehydrogenase (E3) component
LHTIDDARRLDADLEHRGARQVIIVDAGYIGIEMAEALVTRGLHVTVLERLDNVLPRTIDHELANEVAAELARRGVDVSCGTTVAEIQRDGDRLIVKADDGARSADAVLVVSGVTPSSDLAASAGVQVDGRGAIIVDRRMRTNVPDVWAAGDCFHTHHVLLAEPTYLPLGTTGPQAGPSRWRECRRW